MANSAFTPTSFAANSVVNPNATTGTSGIVDGVNGLKGFTDGSTATAGYLGETLSQSRIYSSATAVTTGTPLNITATALTLTPGVWSIRGQAYFEVSSAQITLCYAAISKTSATIPAQWGTPSGDEVASNFRLGSGYFITVTHSIAPYIVNITTNTVFYLVGQASWSTGAGVTVNGIISATRIR